MHGVFDIRLWPFFFAATATSGVRQFVAGGF